MDRDPRDGEASAQLSAAASERLIAVVQELSQARELGAIMQIVRRAARDLTGADGATFVLREGDLCYYAEENAIAPLWKGRRFPLSTCISGWVMLNGRAAVIEDIYADARIPAEAYRPTFVKSLAMVPIRRASPIGAIGNYWATRRLPTADEVGLLQALADTTSVALENAQLYADLAATIESLREQRARVQAQHEALEVFTRALAHDLREPVRTIRSFSSAIAEGEPTDESSLVLFRHIRAAGDRMAALIDAIGTYTQLDDPQLLSREAVSLGEVAAAVQSNLAALIRDRGARVTVGALPVLRANRTQMLQVFQNLISNAVGHGGQGVQVHVGAQRLADTWVLSVRDDGPGIAQEHQGKIFEPFKRLSRDDAHSGLGLAIGRRIVEAHGGQIRCESEPARGATFVVTLPADVPATPQPAALDPAAASRSQATMPVATSSALREMPGLATVLLVDDREADILLARNQLLGHKGMQCNVVVARDGGEALDLMGTMRRKGSWVDLVLLDINMPGIDGFELLERLRRDEALHDLPVVMHTGSSYQKDKERARSLGAVGYLEKPASLEHLRPILDRIAGVRLVDGEGPPALVRQGEWRRGA